MDFGKIWAKSCCGSARLQASYKSQRDGFCGEITMFRTHCPSRRDILLTVSLVAVTCIGSLSLGTTPARAGCNSGDVPDTDLLTSANCQASADGANSTAIGSGAS